MNKTIYFLVTSFPFYIAQHQTCTFCSIKFVKIPNGILVGEIQREEREVREKERRREEGIGKNVWRYGESEGLSSRVVK